MTDLLSLWDSLLTCQVALTMPLELPHYYTCPAWLAAPEVLDLGSGNGGYLIELARRFPEKRYRSVDSDGRWVDVRERRGREAGAAIENTTADLFSIRGSTSAVVARLVAQHLPSPEAFIVHVAGLLSQGGIFISVEPHDALRMFWPEMPGITGLYQVFREERIRAGFDRDVSLRMLAAADTAGLSVLRHAEIAVPSTLPGHRDLFVKFHRLIFSIFEAEYAIRLDRARLETELDNWARHPHSYAQLGIHLVIFARPD
jgi:SAM-dependent methyltransferase